MIFLQCSFWYLNIHCDCPYMTRIPIYGQSVHKAWSGRSGAQLMILVSQMLFLVFQISADAVLEDSQGRFLHFRWRNRKYKLRSRKRRAGNHRNQLLIPEKDAEKHHRGGESTFTVQMPALTGKLRKRIS